MDVFHPILGAYSFPDPEGKYLSPEVDLPSFLQWPKAGSSFSSAQLSLFSSKEAPSLTCGQCLLHFQPAKACSSSGYGIFDNLFYS